MIKIKKTKKKKKLKNVSKKIKVKKPKITTKTKITPKTRVDNTGKKTGFGSEEKVEIKKIKKQAN